MAKYDTYTLTLQLESTQEQAKLVLSVIFEDGDDPNVIMQQVREKVEVEAISMKNSEFLTQKK